ncbi:hypothetical protein BDV96DRAFT_684172 [Lophiotrema nucula]|uniref:Uncharacterized protein n=1 Tax=Lophiotrema nucula TaxID=690887 RepID=A0A6A5ZJ28_9PLEO|nr:hypothetical protein BDV96DRAFT_684172 [Lophiotrema nucula]
MSDQQPQSPSSNDKDAGSSASHIEDQDVEMEGVEQQATSLNPAPAAFVPSPQPVLESSSGPDVGQPEGSESAYGSPQVQWGPNPNLDYVNTPAPSDELPPPRNEFPGLDAPFGAGINPLTIEEAQSGEHMLTPIGLSSDFNLGAATQGLTGQPTLDPPRSIRHWPSLLQVAGGSSHHRALNNWPGVQQFFGGSGPAVSNFTNSLVPSTSAEAEQLLGTIQWIPIPLPGQEGLPRDDLERAALAWMLAEALVECNTARDRQEPAYRRFDPPIWTQAEMVAIGFRVVRIMEDVYANGTGALLFRIPQNIPPPGSPEATMGLTERVEWLARLVRDFKTYADLVMQEIQLLRLIARPITFYNQQVAEGDRRGTSEATGIGNAPTVSYGDDPTCISSHPYFQRASALLAGETRETRDRLLRPTAQSTAETTSPENALTASYGDDTTRTPADLYTHRVEALEEDEAGEASDKWKGKEKMKD